MPKREDAIDQMSRVRQDVRRRMDEAIAAVLDLCWDYRSPDFSFSEHMALQREANKILAQMSDGILSDSEKRAILAMTEAELQDYEEDALEFAEGEIDGEDVLFRLDRHADHLKDLLAGWLAVAAYAGLTKEKTKQNLWIFLGNVGASKDWREAGLKVPKWGRGFPLDTLSGLTVVGQNMINKAFQFSRIKYFQARGAIGYRTIRQSSYICPLCDEMTERIWRLDEYVLPYHSRCVCKAVPVFSDEKILTPEGWEMTYQDKSGGYVMTDKRRIEKGKINKQEAAKYNKEKAMSIVLAQNGYRVEHLWENPGSSSPDININGIPGDLKQTSSANNIVKYANKAIGTQGAQIVIFEFTKENSAIYKELRVLKKKGYRVKYWIKGKNRVRDL